MECAVCMGEYDDQDYRPLCLPCGHTICSTCVSDLSSASDPFFCPTCRKAIPAVEVASLPTNFSLLDKPPEQRKEEQNTILCALHPSKKAKFFCGECKQEFCSKCVVRHTGASHRIEDFSLTLDKKLDHLLLESQDYVVAAVDSLEVLEKKSADLVELKATVENAYETAVATLLKEKDETLEVLKGAVEHNRVCMETAKEDRKQRSMALSEAQELLRSVRHNATSAAEKRNCIERAESLLAPFKLRAAPLCEIRTFTVKRTGFEGKWVELEESVLREDKKEEAKAGNPGKEATVKDTVKSSIHRDAPRKRKEPCWWFLSDSSTWSPYALPLSRQIEAAYQRRELTIDLGKYIVDLTSMMQVNKFTKKQRKVGRDVT